jgi:hypothetical protein
VTNVIPATSKSKNMFDNSKAGIGNMPDAAAKRRMIEIF